MRIKFFARLTLLVAVAAMSLQGTAHAIPYVSSYGVTFSAGVASPSSTAATMDGLWVAPLGNGRPARFEARSTAPQVLGSDQVWDMSHGRMIQLVQRDTRFFEYWGFRDYWQGGYTHANAKVVGLDGDGSPLFGGDSLFAQRTTLATEPAGTRISWVTSRWLDGGSRRIYAWVARDAHYDYIRYRELQVRPSVTTVYPTRTLAAVDRSQFQLRQVMVRPDGRGVWMVKSAAGQPIDGPSIGRGGMRAELRSCDFASGACGFVRSGLGLRLAVAPDGSFTAFVVDGGLYVADAALQNAYRARTLPNLVSDTPIAIGPTNTPACQSAGGDVGRCSIS